MSNESKLEFSASWGTALKLMTGFFFVFFAVIVAVIFSPLGPSAHWVQWAIIAAPVTISLISAFYMVRGFWLRGRTLGIRRLGWTKEFDLMNLRSAQTDPDALRGSVRLFGNGGLFSFTGWYRNKKLGVYRAYVTEARRSVILRFTDKTLVVTPDETERFVSEITAVASRTDGR